MQGRELQDTDGHSSFERFMCGLCAGTLAKLTTHPLDVAKKRFQVAGLARDTRCFTLPMSCVYGCTS